MYYWPERKKLRLEWFDYRELWYYFVTICTRDREEYFGELINGEMILNDFWEIAESVLSELPEHYKNCLIDEYIFMPNHFHGIFIIHDKNVGNGLWPFRWRDESSQSKQHGLSEIIRGFKTFSSKNINASQDEIYFTWQKSFHDIIIMDQVGLDKSREYIRMNPSKWDDDENNIY